MTKKFKQPILDYRKLYTELAEHIYTYGNETFEIQEFLIQNEEWHKRQVYKKTYGTNNKKAR